MKENLAVERYFIPVIAIPNVNTPFGISRLQSLAQPVTGLF
jgi:hypothetical protein